MYAHTASDAVGWSLVKKFALQRTAADVVRGGDWPTPSHDLGGVWRSGMAEAAPARFMFSSA